MALLTLADYESTAGSLAAWPPGVWDFLTGGAGTESTVTANREAFARWRLMPRVCVDVSVVETSTTVLGSDWDLPVAFAPTALHEVCTRDAEAATASAATALGVPMVVSALSSRTIEDIADAAPEATLWQQVYLFRDRKVTASLVQRASAAGAQAIVVTVDVPRPARRLRDIRNELRFPPHVQARNLAASTGRAPDVSSPSAHTAEAMDPSVTWEDVQWLTELSALPVLVKGIQVGQDAEHARRAGAAGVIVSNHGGRQLDRARPTLDALPEIRTAVPSGYPVLLDGGVRTGAEVMIALALGADAVLVGRPVLHGLAVAGKHGAAMVLGILRAELTDAMAQSGHPTLDSVDRSAIHPAPDPALLSADTVPPPAPRVLR
ncbi:alpha-hydroxy acid oxidase [Actinomadura syzygii]|uniref:Alpha-hydroxy-acid oxidizing protein n=1 Tax=Actinomadura syzygii TaxID=1427538 RepID=A0A5D0TTI6_9ACTN|nr:alpha-hydroxy acid oxidase [Actinomadura syzygii]TYC08625.1 alpha-hydroxy-acid oxidizing protein [Actinomadura syzygii]